MSPENAEQLFNLLPLILVILGVGILSIAGWLVWVFTRPGGWRPPGSKEVDMPASADAETPGAAQIEPAAPFLTLTRGLDGWEIAVSGQRYGSLEDVADAETRDEVVDAIRALARFASNYVQRQRSVGPSPTADAADESGPRDPAPTTTDSSVSLQQLPARPPNAAAVDSYPRRIPTTPALIPSINLAQEIGDIVEEMLAETPSLQGHAVTLTSGRGGGIVFAVDGKLYREIDEIPHPEIRELIRQATREWERR